MIGSSGKPRLVCIVNRPVISRQHAAFRLGIEQCLHQRWNLIPDESGPRFAWHTYQKPAPEKWSRFIASVSKSNEGNQCWKTWMTDLNCNISLCDFSHVKANSWDHIFNKPARLNRKNTCVNSYYTETINAFVWEL